MKRILLIVLAALAAAAHPVSAQTFTAAPGYTASLLFAVEEGRTISGLGVNSTGDIFYLSSGLFDEGPDTRLFKHGVETPLFSYGAPVGGNFVRVSGSTVYFAEFDNGTIRAIDANGGAARLVATVPGNFDLAVGEAGAFLSANTSPFPSPAANRVYQIDLASSNQQTSDLKVIVDTGGDNSGPVAVSLQGDLLYGATSTIGGGIYMFTAQQVAGVTSEASTRLTLTTEARRIENDNNQAFAYIDNERLYSATFAPGPDLLRHYDLATGGFQLAGQTGTNDFFTALTAAGEDVLAVVTADFFNGPSAVYRLSVIPEPSSLLLLAVAGGWLLRRRPSQRNRAR